MELPHLRGSGEDGMGGFVRGVESRARSMHLGIHADVSGLPGATWKTLMSGMTIK